MRKHLILSALVVSSAAAIAQAPTETATTTKVGPGNDPNEIVCRRQQEIGSRLNTRRVCRTRAEWAQLRDQTRQVVDRVQENKATVFQ